MMIASLLMLGLGLWTVADQTDPITDRVSSLATLEQPDATVAIGCSPGSDVGGYGIVVAFPRFITSYDEQRAMVRLDSGEPERVDVIIRGRQVNIYNMSDVDRIVANMKGASKFVLQIRRSGGGVLNAVVDLPSDSRAVDAAIAQCSAA